MVWEQDDSKHCMGRPADSPLVIGLLPLKKKLLLNPIWRTDTLLHQPTGHSQPSWTPRDNLANINRLRWCMPLSITLVILITFLILTNWGDAPKYQNEQFLTGVHFKCHSLARVKRLRPNAKVASTANRQIIAWAKILWHSSNNFIFKTSFRFLKNITILSITGQTWTNRGLH